MIKPTSSLVYSMEIRVVRNTISRSELAEMAKQQFVDMVKAVVDVEQGIMAIGGELHSDEEAMLLDQGSQRRLLWGINLYPDSRSVSGSSLIR